MSLAPNLAVTLPNETVLLGVGGALGLIVVALVFIVIRNSRAKKRVVASWTAAAQDLAIDVVSTGSDIGPTVRGKVNEHVVTIAPLPGKGRKRRTSTLYSVRFEAPEAPKFRLNKRMDTDKPTIDTGNPKFDAVVAIYTDHPVLLSRFLTASRRAAILRLLTHWPSAEVTNREAHLMTADLELDSEKLVDSICHLVATAEVFDRPTAQTEPTTIHAPHAAIEDDAPVEDDETDPQPIPTGVAVGTETHVDGDVLTEVRLDEITVLNDLFNADLATEQISARFEQVYQGREVTWAGEVVRVGSVEETGIQRIAALIGSADGQTPESGRVVAITTVDALPVLTPGDVVTFTAALVNLDPEQRLFHLV